MTTPTQPQPTGRVDAPQPAVSVNGTPPGAGAEDCADCVTPGERTLAIIGAVIGVVIVAIAIDLGTGGKLSAAVGLGQKESPPSVDNPGS